MTYYKKMIGEKCYLSPCCAADAEKWTEWDNNLEVTIPLGDEAYTPYSLEKMRTIVSDVNQHQTHTFSIVDQQSNEAIGRCMFFNLDRINRCAMLGIVIGEKSYWGQGYGQDAMKLLLDYGFNLLNLHSIMLGTYSFNQRAINCYKKVGFKEIGRRRQARIIAGKQYDVLFMDILATEFESVFVEKILAEETRSHKPHSSR